MTGTDTAEVTRRHTASRRLSLGLRVASVVSVLTVLIDAALLAAGVISWPVAAVLLLCVEVPLGVVAVSLHVILYRRARRAGASRQVAWEGLVTANPALRLIQVEFGHVTGLPRDVLTLLRGGHRERGRFGYTSGTLVMPVCVMVLLALETVVVHLVVPWAWLRLILLLLNMYAVMLVASVLIGRVANPHQVAGDVLRLRFGRHVVAEVPLASLEGSTVVRRHHTWLAVTGTDGAARRDAPPAVHLANQFGTNVRLRLEQPALVRVPRHLGPDQRHLVDEMHLMVDDPAALLAALDRVGSRVN